MRIVLHAGLHKSGTTSIQTDWKHMYGNHPTAWYPPPPPGPPGHHRLARPLLTAFVDGSDPDLVSAATSYQLRRKAVRQSLVEVIESARARGAEVLIISSENLDRAQRDDRSKLEEVLGPHDVTLVLTVTKPVHRWCAGWQTLVRHGFPQYPVEGRQHILRFANLQPGRLAQLLDLIPAQQRVIRLVRTEPREPQLAHALASSLGLPEVDPPSGSAIRNESLGVDTEIVLRLNRAGWSMGTDRSGMETLRRLKAEGLEYGEGAASEANYVLPAELHLSAHLEREWLDGLRRGQGPAKLLDPHGQLDAWTDMALPDWYDVISRREALLPELDAPLDLWDELWRARQAANAYRKHIESAATRR